MQCCRDRTPVEHRPALNGWSNHSNSKDEQTNDN
jgi:hypothetical protein